MTIKDSILIIISAVALILSFISLIITLVQKNRETKRTIRKNLSDTLESITKITIESTKLLASKDTDINSEPIILLRRNYNTHRRILIAHADYLIDRYDSIVTEIDCNILAGAYSTVGDISKAEYYWQKSIDKSISSPIKVMNLRGFGIFLFNNEKQDLARKKFYEALSIDLADNDENKKLKIDTYLMLCDVEIELGTKENYEKSLIEAMKILSTIKSSQKRNEMHAIISQKLPERPHWSKPLT
ncbi:MAG TPA: hypothetical protein VN721_06595 [Flavipsychrobacter sp.]|nr:hypothetical protein [Flavipsychrobacter sp.]